MTDVRGARIVRLIKDPAVGGDLLLVGLALAAKFDLGLRYDAEKGELATLLWPEAHDPNWKTRQAFKSDIRMYKPPAPVRWRCTAPTPRKPECGRNATTSGYLTDWLIGTMTPVGGCSRHLQWFAELRRANYAAKPDVPPLPCANYGGALRVHFPHIDWPAFWRELDASWVEHPEAHVWPRPDFSLVLGDGEGGLAAAPLLSLVPIGGAS